LIASNIGAAEALLCLREISIRLLILSAPMRGPKHYSRAYLHHLYRANEILGARLNTFHNLYFYQRLMQGLRAAIEAGNLDAFVAEFRAKRGTDSVGSPA